MQRLDDRCAFHGGRGEDSQRLSFQLHRLLAKPDALLLKVITVILDVLGQHVALGKLADKDANRQADSELDNSHFNLVRNMAGRRISGGRQGSVIGRFRQMKRRRAYGLFL